MAVIVVIPARAGSKGLPGKNLRTLAGISLMGHAVRVGRQFLTHSALTGSVCVDTDSPEIAKEGQRWGAEVPFLRPSALATDETTTADAVLCFISRLEQMGRCYDDIVLLQPTSPLRHVEDVTACWRAYDRNIGSVISLAALEHPPQQTLRCIELGTVSLMWPGADLSGRRQDFDQGYRPSGAIYISSVRALRDSRTFIIPGRTRGVIIDAARSIDVDSRADLIAAEGLAHSDPEYEVLIGKRKVGRSNPCYVIAEAGVNHNGNPDLAHRLIDVAARAQADAVKFQTFEPARLVSRHAPMADYQVKNIGARRTQAEMLADLVLPKSVYRDLKQHAEQCGLEFLSTPFDEASADLLDDLSVVAFKIASGDLTNHPFLAHVARKGRVMLVSTGMADIVEVSAALDIIRANGGPPIGLFHCVTSYPSPIDESNLSAIRHMRAAFRCPVGWSDHTNGITAAIAATALGAAMIEKHFTLDRSLPGPDHVASLLPDELESMVAAIREVESARGDGLKEPRTIEMPLRSVARKSLHAARDLPAGTLLACDDLIALRPGTGISPALRHTVVGKRLLERLDAGQIIEDRVLG